MATNFDPQSSTRLLKELIIPNESEVLFSQDYFVRLVDAMLQAAK